MKLVRLNAKKMEWLSSTTIMLAKLKLFTLKSVKWHSSMLLISTLKK